MPNAVPGAAQLKRLRVSHQSQINAMCDAARPHVDAGFFIRPQKQVGGDSVFLRRFHQESDAASGRAVHYYWIHHWDVMGKGYDAHVFSQKMEAAIQAQLDGFRSPVHGPFEPAAFIRNVAQRLHDAHGVDLDGPDRLSEPYRSICAHLGILAVHEKEGRPVHADYFHANFAGQPIILHDSASGGATSGRFLCEGEGSHGSGMFLLFQKPEDVPVGVHALHPGQTMFFYGDGLLDKYHENQDDVRSIVQRWTGGSAGEGVAFVKKRRMDAIKTNHDDVSLFAIRIPFA